MSLIRPVLNRLADTLLPPRRQFATRTADALDIIVQGWESGASNAEIAEAVWEMVKRDAPKLKEKLAFFRDALRAGLGGSDLLHWARTSGRWDDDPAQYLNGGKGSAREVPLEEGTGLLAEGASEVSGDLEGEEGGSGGQVSLGRGGHPKDDQEGSCKGSR